MYARATALICAYALVANIVAIPAPPRRSEKRGLKNKIPLPVKEKYDEKFPYHLPGEQEYHREKETMPQERTIVIRRVPNRYLYPFSLWPLPKYPITEDRTSEYIYNGKTLKKIKKVEKNKR